VSQQPADEHGGREEGLGGDTKRRHHIPPLILRAPRPAVPPLGRPIDQRCLGVLLQQLHLVTQLLWQPDIIGIEEGEVGATGLRDTEVAGGTHAAIGVLGVAQVAHPLGIASDELLGNRRTAIGRAIIDQQEFPVGIGLGDDAGDRLGQEWLSIPEDDDH